MIMVSVCLPSDALSQHLPSYLDFSYLGRGISLHSYSSKAQLLLLTLDEGYILTAAIPHLERGVTPLGPLQPLFLGHGVAPLGPAPELALGVVPLGCCPSGMGSSRLLPLTLDVGRSSRPRLCAVTATHAVKKA